MKTAKIKVEQKCTGQRLDVFLAAHFKDEFSRTYLQGLISGGDVLVNGNTQKANYRVAAKDLIEIALKEKSGGNIIPQNLPLDIIYEDEDLLVVNKPAGMVTHPGTGVTTGTLANALAHHCKSLSSLSGNLRPGIVHRLDKDTSGVMLVAKNDDTHRALSGQFKDRAVERKYLALVRGAMEFDRDVIELPIGRHPLKREKMSVRYADSKEAVTKYRVIRRLADVTLVEVMPVTGRTHQIRVHMAAIGHPIMGDLKYGIRGKFKRQALHAYKIKFFHPGLKKNMEFTCEPPEDLKKYF